MTLDAPLSGCVGLGEAFHSGPVSLRFLILGLFASVPHVTSLIQSTFISVFAGKA